MSNAQHPTYVHLCSLAREGSTLASIGALLSWDQETYMPPAGADGRASQMSVLAGLIHERRIDPKIGEAITVCEAQVGKTIAPESPEAANIREMRRDFDLATKLPRSLVEDWAKTTSQANDVWKKARAQRKFKDFAPWLEKVFALARQKAGCYGWDSTGEPYDALLNLYEPGVTAREVETVFTPLRKRLADLIARVAASKSKVDTKALSIPVDPAVQHAFNIAMLGAMGFDLNAGRLDVTTHPFCEGLWAGDTRLTTRYKGDRWVDALYGTLHEMGHGHYEQGLPKGDETIGGTPLAEAISLGIHESQSRMWENFVGRGRPFVDWLLPQLKKKYAKGFAKVKAPALYAAVNTCTPSFIRVEADEATYNMHVMIRFELERAVLRGDLAAKDVPGEWNAKYKEYLGVKVPHDGVGCLQDIHWASGLIGYFPTYTLGNLYAAQLWETIGKKNPKIETQIAKGDFAPLKKWLNKNIHTHGRRYRAAELCKRLTGKPLSADPLMRHLEGKLSAVYGI
ncbi:MAG: carboxypeptidase M32 [Planctomycetota bacterium]